jgi:hypothetical protein
MLRREEKSMTALNQINAATVKDQSLRSLRHTRGPGNVPSGLAQSFSAACSGDDPGHA